MICVAILLAWIALAAAIVALIWRNAANRRAFEALREQDRVRAYWFAMYQQQYEKPGEASHDVETRGPENRPATEGLD